MTNANIRVCTSATKGDIDIILNLKKEVIVPSHSPVALPCVPAKKHGKIRLCLKREAQRLDKKINSRFQISSIYSAESSGLDISQWSTSRKPSKTKLYFIDNRNDKFIWRVRDVNRIWSTPFCATSNDLRTKVEAF